MSLLKPFDLDDDPGTQQIALDFLDENAPMGIREMCAERRYHRQHWTPKQSRLAETTMLIEIEVDETDAQAIHAAISRYMSGSHMACGEVVTAEGDSSLRGAILAEICRGWQCSTH